MKFLRALFLKNRFFVAIGAFIVLFVLGYFYPLLFPIVQVLFAAFTLTVIIDILFLFRSKGVIQAVRECPGRLSNGDDNEIRIYLENSYPFTIHLSVIDELPFVFQRRDVDFQLSMTGNSSKIISYTLRPVERGEYNFGTINLLAAGPIGLLQRRFTCAHNQLVAVYPSYLQMRKYELLAHSNRLTDFGIKKIRKVGQTMEFDQIRDYVVGDDYRDINWNATARRSSLMVNQYQDERSQHVYNVIDTGRTMKMPFEGMALVDYAINASLVISNIALYKQDKIGLITFSNKIGTLLPAERKRSGMHTILQHLYNQQTEYPEADYELLYKTLRHKLTTRSLIILYTNFETLSGLQRQLPYLRGIARTHLLVVVFFENTELRTLLADNSRTTEEAYIKTIAEKFAFEKRQIVKELERHGIHSVLTPPQGLTVNTINKYLEIKARRLL